MLVLDVQVWQNKTWEENLERKQRSGKLAGDTFHTNTHAAYTFCFPSIVSRKNKDILLSLMEDLLVHTNTTKLQYVKPNHIQF